jgi:predicted DNA-binding transcriptional regulator AlpA
MVKLINRSKTPDALRAFDELSDSGYIRLPTMCGLFDVSVSTIWRWTRTGRLPPAEKIGPRTTAWNVGLVRKALESGIGEFEPVVIKKPGASDDGKRAK